jgi:hypothetical protein
VTARSTTTRAVNRLMGDLRNMIEVSAISRTDFAGGYHTSLG